MSTAWVPKNFEEACKRNAGRRKLHMRKRKERAGRILGLLTAMEATPQLRAFDILASIHDDRFGCHSSLIFDIDPIKSNHPI